MLRPPARPIPDSNAEVGVTELGKTHARTIGQFLDNLDTPNMTYKFGQNGRLVAQPGADLENCLAPLGVKQVLS